MDSRRPSEYRIALLVGSMRQYIMNEVKKPLMKTIIVFARDYPERKKFLEKAVIVLAKRYPEPTREKCRIPNTLRLFDIRDRFFQCFEFEDELERKAFKAIWKIVIAEYEHDPYYRYRIDFIIEYITEMGWDSELPIEHNLGILTMVRDRFFEYEDNSGRDALFKAIWQILIVEYKTASSMIDWIFEEMVKISWQPRPVQPMSHWKEPGMAGICAVVPLTPEEWAKVVHTEEPLRSALLKDIICSGERSPQRKSEICQ